MEDPNIKHVREIEPYQGPGSLSGIAFRPAGKALGVTAWGMNVIEIAPGVATYPEHDHVEDGQEEVYVVLEGSATLRAAGRERRLERGAIVRVGPQVKRKWLPGENGVTLLAIGGTPRQAG